jgi:hypothetical protein
VHLFVPGAGARGLAPEALVVEAPRLRALLDDYERRLAESGLPRMIEDGYGR